MSTGKRNFDQAAGTWDDNLSRVKLAEEIAQAISRQIVLTTEMDVLDFGCGTGLLTLHLQPSVRSIKGVDSSPGMLEVLKGKITRLGLTNVQTELVDIDRGQSLTGEYDVVVSSMTIHHIPNIEPLLKQFYHVIKPGGYLGIADLDLDGGLFHSDRTGVFHPGFDRATLSRLFTQTGFDDLQTATAAAVEKPDPNGQMRQFSVFLIVGRKRQA